MPKPPPSVSVLVSHSNKYSGRMNGKGRSRDKIMEDLIKKRME
jgi:hypothetical protein